ncbi:thioesterase family protein [Micromonospora sp. WMMD1102]|uniref:acyl-CoA thioesterase n=1 Tax=Micromonosporaceae TaxID=28056 RepID=UPI002414D7B8|nr:thioesterase family protein [Micromonospora sp. WMMD1102]MDG4785338.1 thioesterase family protein [Micromonospora sp. WMMD1102]
MAEPASIVTSRRLEWSETDPMGRWHYSTALRFVEHAETSLHQRLGVGMEALRRMPRVNVTVDFLGPLHHTDVAQTALAVEHVGRSSLRYAFSIARDGVDVARGSLTIAWYDPATGRTAPWPEEIRELFTAAGPQEG